MRLFLNVPRLAILVFAVGLLGGSAVVAACAPSAPDGQGQPVATKTKPTVEPTPTLGSDSAYVGPMAIARINAVAGDGTRNADDEQVRIHVVRDGSTSSIHAVNAFVADNGGTVLESDGRDARLQVPVSLLTRLAQQPEVKAVLFDESQFPYPSMDRTLNNVIAASRDGSTPEQAAMQALIHYHDMV